MIFKVALGKQIHLINSQDKLKLQQLLALIPTIFKNLPRRYALTYLDEDGDEITLKEQDDYDVLLSSGLKTAKILIRENLEEIVDLTNEFVIQEAQEKKEEIKIPQVVPEEPKQPEGSFLAQEIDESLIQEKLKQMMPHIISKVKSEITEELSERSRISSRNNEPIIIEEPIFHKNVEKKPEKPEDKKVEIEKVVHSGVTCDSCNTRDIEGVRYKCSVCSNFDFCERCQATVDHPHPFLKIKTLKQTPVHIFAVINEEGEPSIEANGQRFPVPPQFENLAHHGLGLLRGFFGGANQEEFRNRCHAARQEWKKRSHELKKGWGCYRNCGEKQEMKTETKPEQKVEEKIEPKVEAKVEEKPQPKVQDKPKPVSGSYDTLKENANYLVGVFGFPFEKCLKWAQMYPYMSKEELLNFCLSDPSFYN